MAEIEFKGLDSLRNDLRRLDFSQQEEVLVAAALDAAEPLRDRAAELAPRLTRALSRGIIKQKSKDSDLNQITVEVGASSKVFWGYFQEFGTATTDPQPFFWPALEQTQRQVEDGFVDALNKQIALAVPRT